MTNKTPSNLEVAIANGVVFTLPTAILQQDSVIIDEQDGHIVLTVRVPIDVIRDNVPLLRALMEIAEKPRAAEPENDLDDAEGDHAD